MILEHIFHSWRSIRAPMGHFQRKHQPMQDTEAMTTRAYCKENNIELYMKYSGYYSLGKNK